jgi:predicted nucleic acid-binding protein
MKTVIDTSAIIAFLRKVKPGDQVARLLESNQAVIPAVCVFELLAGVKSPVHIHQRQQLLSLAEIIPMDRKIAETAAELFTKLRSTGKTIDNEDLMVAATALFLDIPVLTVNKVYFGHIPEIITI